MGILLFVKLVLEDFEYGISGFWSLDLGERVVREKIGSLLVVVSMILQTEESSVPTPNNHLKTKEKQLSSLVNYGELQNLPILK